MHAYVLLDRSGSMQTLWVEALSSVNAYAKGLTDKSDGYAVDSHITLAVFDGQQGLQFDLLRKKVPALHWENVTDREASPRGMTPLLDALGNGPEGDDVRRALRDRMVWDPNAQLVVLERDPAAQCTSSTTSSLGSRTCASSNPSACFSTTCIGRTRRRLRPLRPSCSARGTSRYSLYSRLDRCRPHITWKCSSRAFKCSPRARA